MKQFHFSLRNLQNILFYLTILFLPTQFGRHFWPPFSFVSGIRVDYLSPTLFFTDVLLFLLFLFSMKKTFRALVHFFSHRSIPFFITIGFFMTLFIGGILAINKGAFVLGLLRFLEGMFFCYCTRNFFKQKNTQIAFPFLLALPIIFESLLAIAQFFLGQSVGSIFYFFGERSFTGVTPGIANASLNGQLILRPYATFPHPNVLAGYLVSSLLFLFLLLFSSKNKRLLVFFIPVFILGSFALFLILSRVAIFLEIVLLLVFGITFINQRFGKRGVSIFSFLATLVLAAILFATPLHHRFFFGSFFSDESVTMRASLQTAAISMFLKHPFFGVGLSNFLPNLPLVLSNSGTIFYLQPVHNIFLLTLSETGLFGFLCIFLFCVFLTKRAWQQKNLFFLPILCIGFLGLFDHYPFSLQQGRLLMAFLIGVFLSRRK